MGIESEVSTALESPLNCGSTTKICCKYQGQSIESASWNIVQTFDKCLVRCVYKLRFDERNIKIINSLRFTTVAFYFQNHGVHF